MALTSARLLRAPDQVPAYLLSGLAGAAVLAAREAPGFGRVGTVLSVVVGACAIYSAFLVIPVEGEQSPFGLPLVIAFWGVPQWGVGASYRLPVSPGGELGLGLQLEPPYPRPRSTPGRPHTHRPFARRSGSPRPPTGCLLLASTTTSPLRLHRHRPR